jgi:protein-S-isoprenylcysteine O-methyltransferase Ste14
MGATSPLDRALARVLPFARSQDGPLVLAARAILFAVLCPGSVTALVPFLLVRTGYGDYGLGAWRWAGAVPAGLGAAGLVWCIVDFARVGGGTLAPVDPPKKVVHSGLYAHVRNPMYVSVVLVLAGEALLFSDWLLVVWMGGVALMFHGFVVFYEEPKLARTFGDSYAEYRRDVPRWLPRIRRAMVRMQGPRGGAR